MSTFDQTKEELDTAVVKFDSLKPTLVAAMATCNPEQLAQLYSTVSRFRTSVRSVLTLLQPHGAEDARADELLETRVKPAVQKLMDGTPDPSLLRDNMVAIFNFTPLPCEMPHGEHNISRLKDADFELVTVWSATFPAEEWLMMDHQMFCRLFYRIRTEIVIERLPQSTYEILRALTTEKPLNRNLDFWNFVEMLSMDQFHHASWELSDQKVLAN